MPRISRAARDLVEVETYAHATEDPSKVEAAIMNILPERLRGLVNCSRKRLKGHYGNPITVYRLTIEDVAEEFLHSLIGRMSWDDKVSLRANLDIHIGRHKILYLRFNKQEAYLGHLRIGHRDPICVRIKLKPHIFRRLPELINP